MSDIVSIRFLKHENLMMSIHEVSDVFSRSFFLTVITLFAYSQNLRQEDEIFRPSVSTRAALITEYVQLPFAPKGYLSSTLLGNYRMDEASLGFYLNVNKHLLFEIREGPVVIELPDSALLLEQNEIIFPPNSYQIDNPLALCGSYRFNHWEVQLSSRLYTQAETKWGHRLIDAGNKTYYITVENSTYRRADIFLTGALSFSKENFSVLAGVSGARAASWGNFSDDALNNLQIVKLRPVFRVGVPMFSGTLFGETNTKAAGLSHTIDISIPWVSENRPLVFSSAVQLKFEAPQYESIELSLVLPVHSNVSVAAGYTRAWSNFDLLTKQKFNLWRSSFSSTLNGEPLSGIEHTAVTLGAAVELGSTEIEFPLDLVGAKIFHKNIYSAKKDFYAYNPVGTLELKNRSNRSVMCQVVMELQNNFGSYRSESMKVEPNEVKTVPLFLYLSEEKMSGQSSLTQMDISIQTNEKKHLLSTIPLTLFDVHSWDGNTYGLRYYLTPNEPVIQTNAKRKYLQALTTDSLSTESQRRIAQLRLFLSELGSNLHYLQDPTTSLYVDHVQYPIETMELQSGDCEDLVVYTASHLMAVGIQCAFVDIRPDVGDVPLPAASQTNGANAHQRRVGHILLLVNTEIESEQMSEAGLHEFQFVSRASTSGKNTIWLPIETTVLDGGFDKAFAEGVRQYYKEVIEQDGMKKGVVHVYDF